MRGIWPNSTVKDDSVDDEEAGQAREEMTFLVAEAAPE